MLSQQEISRIISEDYNSKQKQSARTGQNYYEGKHDIRNYRIFYFDGNGDLREDKYRSNVKITHPFFTEIVNQAVQYIFSGKKFAKSDNPKLQKYLDEYFNCNETFASALAELLRGCMTKGCEYLYMYRNADGNIAFDCADCRNVIEVRAEDNDDNKDYIIYCYDDTENKGKRKIRKIQVWDKEKVWFYIQSEGGTVRTDETQPVNPVPHTVYLNQNGKFFYESFGMLPFFRLDNNAAKASDLAVIKELIDDYDLMASSLSNNLIDFDMPIYAVTGFEGDNLDSLQQNLKSKKIVGLDEGGGVDIKTVDVPYQARKAKLELDEKNIYRFGMGLNIDVLRDTSATTNIAIKAAYSLLDLKCAKLEMGLKKLLRKIVRYVIEDINTRHRLSFSHKDVSFEFSHQVMSNAYENAQIEKLTAEENQIKMQTLLSVADTLDNETILRSICCNLEISYDEVSSRINEWREKL